MRSGSKLPPRTQEAIRQDRKRGMSIHAIATKRGVSWGTINTVIKGHSRSRAEPDSRPKPVESARSEKADPAPSPAVQVALLQQELSFAKDQLGMVLQRLEAIGA